MEERAQASLRADEEFRRVGEQMQQRDRWQRGGYSDDEIDKDDDDAAGDSKNMTALRQRLRQPGPPLTTAELAVLLGLREAPSKNNGGNNETNCEGVEGTSKVMRQSLLAPLPNPDPTGWKTTQKEGRKRSSPTSSSASRASSGNAEATVRGISAVSSSSHYGFPEVGSKSVADSRTSSGNGKKKKRSRSVSNTHKEGAGSTFLSKMKKQHKYQRKGEERHTSTQAFEMYDNDSGTDSGQKSFGSGNRERSSTGTSRLFKRTPARMNSSLTQTSVLDHMSSKE